MATRPARPYEIELARARIEFDAATSNGATGAGRRTKKAAAAMPTPMANADAMFKDGRLLFDSIYLLSK
jgi:hypothetical protein